MPDIDEFVLNYTLERLDKKIDQHKKEQEGYEVATELALESLRKTTEGLLNEGSTMDGSLNTLVELVTDLTLDLKETKRELNKTKMANIKQEIVVRTLHNMNSFAAHDMYVDTFTDSTNIDWPISIRGEWFSDLLAIGKTSASSVKVQQTSMKEPTLISANGSDDRALSQLFQIDKDQDIDKVSLYVTKHNENTWQPLIVSIRDINGGMILVDGKIDASKIVGGWVDIDLGNIRLNKFLDYYIDVRTDDTYGYRIGVDKSGDRYFSGTSYNLFNGVWTDNNFDLAFKVWCFAADDENDTTIITKKMTLATLPTSIVFDVEAVTIDGSINYFVSRDDGLNWKILQPGMETDLNDLPEGKDIRIKVYLLGNSRVDAWGYVIKRSDK